MTNLNTPEYLEKCKIRIIENLRHCQFAPSVQGHPVPADMFSDSELEEPSDDENAHGDKVDDTIFGTYNSGASRTGQFGIMDSDKQGLNGPTTKKTNSRRARNKATDDE